MMISPPPLPLPHHDETLPPPRIAPALAPYQVARGKTPEEEVKAEVRGNLLGTAIFVGLMALVLWASRRPARTEAIDQVGSLLLVLTDLVAVVLITLEPFHLRRKKAAPAAGEGRSAADVKGIPTRLVWSNALFGFSGAGLIIMLTLVRGVQMLGESILMSLVLLQFYRAVLLLFSFGAAEAWAGMRKWKVKHWTSDNELHDAG